MAHTAAAWIAALFLATSLFAGTVALRLMLLIAGVALCAWVAFRDRSVRKLPPIWIPFLAWAAWAALSLAWSIDFDRSQKEFRNEVLYTGAALWMGFVAAQARHGLKIIAAVVAAASVAACAIGLYYFAVEPTEYANGAHGGAGNHSSVLLMVMPAALIAGYYASEQRNLRWLLAVSLGFVVFYGASAYGTLNRTVWLGFGVQIVLIMVLWRASAANGLRGRLMLGLVAMAIAAGALGMTWKTQVEREAIGAPEVGKDPRIVIWREALERIEERPWTGYGFGRGLLRKELTTDTRDGYAWHSHNLLLDSLIQAGIPALALLLVLLAATVRRGIAMARTADPVAKACGIALVALVAGMLVRNMTDVLWVRHIALFYWGAVGVLLAQAATRPTARA